MYYPLIFHGANIKIRKAGERIRLTPRQNKEALMWKASPGHFGLNFFKYTLKFKTIIEIFRNFLKDTEKNKGCFLD
jgi:hypothetical protein